MTATPQAAHARRRIFGYAPTVLLLGLVSLTNDMASEMIYPLLPVFLTSVGASMTFVGLVEGVAEATASVSSSSPGGLPIGSDGNARWWRLATG